MNDNAWPEAVKAAYTRIAQEFPELSIEGRDLLLAIMVENFQQFAERAFRLELMRQFLCCDK